MIFTRSIGSFFRQNRSQLRAYALSRGIPHRDVEDCIGDYMTYLINSQALQRYDPVLGSFSNYVLTSFSWTLNNYWAASRPTDFREDEDLPNPTGIDEVRVLDFRLWMCRQMACPVQGATGLAGRVLQHLEERIAGDSTCNTYWSHRFNQLASTYRALENT